MDKYNKIKQLIADCVAELAKENLISQKDSISVRVASKVAIATNINMDLPITEQIKVLEENASCNGEIALHLGLYKKRKGINAIISINSPYAKCVGKTGVAIPAVVDDIAQIVGPTTRIAPTRSLRDIVRALKGRNGCIVSGSGPICIGRTLDEAATACLVLEKGAKIFIEASILGGAKSINRLEAALMHFIYKKKYSQADQSAKMAEILYEE